MYVISYFQKQNDKNTVCLLRISNFKDLFGLIILFFEFEREEIAIYRKHCAKRTPDGDIRECSIVLYEEKIHLNEIEIELVVA